MNCVKAAHEFSALCCSSSFPALSGEGVTAWGLAAGWGKSRHRAYNQSMRNVLLRSLLLMRAELAWVSLQGAVLFPKIQPIMSFYMKRLV